MCPLDKFIEAEKEVVRKTDWDWGCRGDWKIPPGWETVTGDPPRKESVLSGNGDDEGYSTCEYCTYT